MPQSNKACCHLEAPSTKPQDVDQLLEMLVASTERPAMPASTPLLDALKAEKSAGQGSHPKEPYLQGRCPGVRERGIQKEGSGYLQLWPRRNRSPEIHRLRPNRFHLLPARASLHGLSNIIPSRRRLLPLVNLRQCLQRQPHDSQFQNNIDFFDDVSMSEYSAISSGPPPILAQLAQIV